MKNKTEYMKIYDKLREDISSGFYAYASKIPSKRVCADRFGVSVITVEHAYELLEDEGYITPRQRSGYFVSYDENQMFGERPAADHRNTGKEAFSELSEEDSIIEHESGKKLSEGLSEPSAGIPDAPDEFPFTVYAKAVRKVLSDRGAQVLLKSPGQGSIELRTAVCGYLARSRNISASPEQIVIGSGAEHLYGLIIDMLGRYRVYGIENPSYGKIHQVYRLNGAQTELLDLGRDGIKRKALEQSGIGVLHITPYRSYPSGITASAAKKREYLNFAKKRGAWIIEDDFESEFTPSSKPVETLFEIDGGTRVIYVNSFTMTISPGIRVAYMVLPQMLLPVFRERLGFCSCTVPTLEQLVLAELISDGGFERHINRVRRHNKKDRP
ncbi:MAG: PLP-dependent aminotransferase family protein [Firmicutes bacterium]|nr:PLP-dependent aminotransferase family protein [Bacillota bacterium]